MKPPANAQEKRAQIMKTAEQLFRHYGYTKTTVADIALACGMSAANVYRFFPSKAAINDAICGLVISELESGLRQIAAAGSPAPERLLNLIELITRYIADTYDKERNVHEMVTAALEENWSAVQNHIIAVIDIFASVIESGIEAKEFMPQDPKRAAQCACFALAGFWHPAVAAQSRELPSVPTVSDMSSFIMSALGGNPAEQGPIRRGP